MSSRLVSLTDQGLYCSQGDFYIDPWQAVDRAVITHAHSDHARRGSKTYLTAAPGKQVLRSRLGDVSIETLEYGETRSINGVSVSFHPAGHVLGSAQIRIAYRGEVWVVSGDYKTQSDPTCAPLEPVRCHTFISESTFGLPIFRWPDASGEIAEINRWWSENRQLGRATVLYAYSFGKAQRLLTGLDPSIGPIFVHPSVMKINDAYIRSGVHLPETRLIDDSTRKIDFSGALMLLPPASGNASWLRRIGECATGFASGWMRIRGHRRRRALDRGFIISDHADWDGLLAAIAASGAREVLVSHGYTDSLVRWLEGRGLVASGLKTEFLAEDYAGIPESTWGDLQGGPNGEPTGELEGEPSQRSNQDENGAQMGGAQIDSNQPLKGKSNGESSGKRGGELPGAEV